MTKLDTWFREQEQVLETVIAGVEPLLKQLRSRDQQENELFLSPDSSKYEEWVYLSTTRSMFFPEKPRMGEIYKALEEVHTHATSLLKEIAFRKKTLASMQTNLPESD